MISSHRCLVPGASARASTRSPVLEGRAPRSGDVSPGAFSGETAAGDLDGDGFADLVLAVSAERGLRACFGVHEGAGDGRFAGPFVVGSCVSGTTTESSSRRSLRTPAERLQ